MPPSSATVRSAAQFLIAEEIPSKNKGEQAIFSGIVASLTEQYGYGVSLITRYPEDQLYAAIAQIYRDEFLSSRQGVWSLAVQSAKLLGLGVAERLLGRERLRSWKLRPAHTALLNADVLFIGHDNVFAKDVNLRCAPIVAYARLARKPLVAYGASIGPFPKRSLKIILFRYLVLRRLRLLTLRDPESRNQAAEAGVRQDRLRVTADLAFLLKPASPERTRELRAPLHLPDTGVVAVTATRLLLDHVLTVEGERRDPARKDYEACYAAIATFLDTIIERHGVHLLLVAHAIGPHERHDDRPVNDAIFAHLAAKERASVVNQDLRAAEVKALLGTVDFLIGMRTHSLIAAASMRTPCMALTTPSRFKTNGIIGEQLGLGEALVYVDHLSAATLSGRFAQLWQTRDRLRETLCRTVPTVVEAARSNGQYVADLVASGTEGTGDRKSVSRPS